MQPLVLTESQWRIVARIEDLATEEWFFDECVRRPMLCPSYPAGEWYLAWAPSRNHGAKFVGPVLATFSVVEWRSRLVLGAADDAVSAYQLARAWLRELPPEVIATLRQRGEEAIAAAKEKAAQSEALAAIARAKAAPKPRKIGRRARSVFEASAGKCHYCSCELQLEGKWHIEHKFPRALFGGSEQSNLVAACVQCNLAKKDKTDLEFQSSQRV